MARRVKPARQKTLAGKNFYIVAILLLLGFGYFVFTSTISISASLADLESSLASGHPTVLEVYSDT